MKKQRPKSGPIVPTERPMTYWLTRDRDGDGVLSDSVDVWLARPKMVIVVPGTWVYWKCDEETVQTSDGAAPVKYAVWTLANCLRNCRVYPDDETMLICNGNPEEDQKKARELT